MKEGRERSTRRSRGVVLTPQARERLANAVKRKWETSESGKLTIEKRADLLGLSKGTSERIFRGEAVDRLSLAQAFRNVGEPLAESDWVLPQRSDPEYPSEFAPEGHDAPQPELVKQGSSKRPFANKWTLGVVLLIVATMLLAMEPWSQWRREQVYHQRNRTFYGLYNRSLDQFIAGQYSESEKNIREAISFSTPYRDAGFLSEGYALLAQIIEAQGRLDEAASAYQTALSFRDVLEGEVGTAPILENFAVLEAKRGNFAAAEAHLDRCIEIHTRNYDNGNLGAAYRSLGEVLVRQERYSEAKAHLTRAHRLALGVHQPDLVADIRSLLGVVVASEGNLPEARAHLRSSLQHWIQKDHTRWMARTRYRAGWVEMFARNWPDALEHANYSKALFREAGDPVGAQDADRLIAIVLDSRPPGPLRSQQASPMTTP